MDQIADDRCGQDETSHQFRTRSRLFERCPLANAIEKTFAVNAVKEINRPSRPTVGRGPTFNGIAFLIRYTIPNQECDPINTIGYSRAAIRKKLFLQ